MKKIAKNKSEECWVEKVINDKDHELYIKWKGYNTIVLLTVGLIKKR